MKIEDCYSKYYIQGSDHYLIPNYEFEKLLKENQELNKQVKEYKATNKVISHELTKDKILEQDYLTTCCEIPIGDIPKLITQRRKFIKYLEDMRDELKNKFKYDICYVVVQIILQKYKEIIGGKNEKQ